MTAYDLLTDMYNSKEVAAVIQRMSPDIAEDILQHTFMELYEKAAVDPDFFLNLNAKGSRDFKFYIVKCLYNNNNWLRTGLKKQLGREESYDFNYADTFDEDPTLGNMRLEISRERRKMQQAAILEEMADMAEQEMFETVDAAIEEMAEGPNWYIGRLLKWYAELETYKAVSEKTLIPLTSVFSAVKKGRQRIIENL